VKFIKNQLKIIYHVAHDRKENKKIEKEFKMKSSEEGLQPLFNQNPGIP